MTNTLLKLAGLVLGSHLLMAGSVQATEPLVNVCVSSSGRIVYVQEEGVECNRGYDTVTLAVEGPQGAPGLDGTNGVDGEDGLDGVDAPDRTLDICILYDALSDTLSAPDYCPQPEPVNFRTCPCVLPGGAWESLVTTPGTQSDWALEIDDFITDELICHHISIETTIHDFDSTQRAFEARDDCITGLNEVFSSIP